MSTTSRKANGQGHTYKIKGKNSYCTVYKVNGKVITATAKDRQTSRALAKAKFDKLPISSAVSPLVTGKINLGDFLTRWLNNEHKQAIAHTTYKRYESLSRIWIIPEGVLKYKCRESIICADACTGNGFL
jgi:hypothetical protein